MISVSAFKGHRWSFYFKICIARSLYLCFGIDAIKWTWHIYFSRNSTPWASTIYFGSNWRESIAAKIRRKKFGILFNPKTSDHDDEAILISKKMQSM